MEEKFKSIPPLEGYHQILREQKPEVRPAIQKSHAASQIDPEQHLNWVDIIRRVAYLEKELERQKSFFVMNTVPINTLGNNKWEVRQPLNVAIEQRGEEDFVACLYDANLYGYGDTIPEALEDLKAVIINQFEYLIGQESKTQIAKRMKKQLNFLKKILVKANV
jgi:hypothetical protein